METKIGKTMTILELAAFLNVDRKTILRHKDTFDYERVGEKYVFYMDENGRPIRKNQKDQNSLTA